MVVDIDPNTPGWFYPITEVWWDNKELMALGGSSAWNPRSQEWPKRKENRIVDFGEIIQDVWSFVLTHHSQFDGKAQSLIRSMNKACEHLASFSIHTEDKLKN